MIICSFSDWHKPLDEAPRHLKGAALHKWLLKSIKVRDRVSCWEIDSNRKVCNALMFLKKIGKITFTNKYDYPYTSIEIK